MSDETRVDAQNNTDASQEQEQDKEQYKSVLDDDAGEEATKEGDQDQDQKPDGEGQDEGAQEGKGEDEQEPEGAPEEYADFEIPEGIYSLDENTLSEFKGIAKELNLTQEQAQRLVNFDVKREQAQYEQAEKWADEFRQRPNYKEELKFAAKGRDYLARDDKELGFMLKDPRIGNNPVFIRTLEKVGRMVAEDDMIDSGSRGKGGEKATEDVLFGDMFDK